MKKHLSSKETLEKLCRTRPPAKTLKELSQGALLGWTAMLGIGAVSGTMLMDNPAQRDEIMPFFVFDVGALGYVMTKLLEKTALYDSLKTKKGEAVYTGNGFTKTPSIADRIFGKKVHAVEDPSQLSSHVGKYVLISGVHITDRRRPETRYMLPESPPSGPAADWCDNDYKPRDRYDDEIILKGEFKGKNLTARVEDKYYDFTRNLKGADMYLIGRMKKEDQMSIETLGIVLER